MKTIENEHKIEFHSEDEYGSFMVRICKKPPIQLQLHSANDDFDAFINVNKMELTAIRDMINKVLQEKK